MEIRYRFPFQSNILEETRGNILGTAGTPTFHNIDGRDCLYTASNSFYARLDLESAKQMLPFTLTFWVYPIPTYSDYICMIDFSHYLGYNTALQSEPSNPLNFANMQLKQEWQFISLEASEDGTIQFRKNLEAGLWHKANWLDDSYMNIAFSNRYGRFFTGYFSDLRIYNGVLSLSELKFIYNHSFILVKDLSKIKFFFRKLE